MYNSTFVYVHISPCDEGSLVFMILKRVHEPRKLKNTGLLQRLGINGSIFGYIMLVSTKKGATHLLLPCLL